MQSPPTIEKPLLQVEQKVELRQLWQLEGQLSHRYVEVNENPVEQVVHAVELVQASQLDIHCRHADPVK